MVASAVVGTDRGRAEVALRRPGQPHLPIPASFRCVHHRLVFKLPPPIWGEGPSTRRQVPHTSSKTAERGALSVAERG
jgi:hypothetical protein